MENRVIVHDTTYSTPPRTYTILNQRIDWKVTKDQIGPSQI